MIVSKSIKRLGARRKQSVKDARLSRRKKGKMEFKKQTNKWFVIRLSVAKIKEEPKRPTVELSSSSPSSSFVRIKSYGKKKESRTRRMATVAKYTSVFGLVEIEKGCRGRRRTWSLQCLTWEEGGGGGQSGWKSSQREARMVANFSFPSFLFIIFFSVRRVVMCQLQMLHIVKCRGFLVALCPFFFFFFCVVRFYQTIWCTIIIFPLFHLSDRRLFYVWFTLSVFL